MALTNRAATSARWFRLAIPMREFEEPGEQAYLSRSEVELELARLALAVMRAAPDTFEDLGGKARQARSEQDLPAELASRLLSRTRPEHRPFVESRLLELARCLAGVRSDAVHEWLNLTLDVRAPSRIEPAAPAPERHRR